MRVNNTLNGAILAVTGGKRNQIDAADHLIFNVHNLFDSNLVKIVL